MTAHSRVSPGIPVSFTNRLHLSVIFFLNNINIMLASTSRVTSIDITVYEITA